MIKPISNLFFINAFDMPWDYHWDENFTFYGEKHDSWEVVYVLSGEVEATEDERIYHLKAGDMIFHAPLEFHKIRSYARTNPHVYVFGFESSGNLPESLKNGVISLSEEEQAVYRRLFSIARQIQFDEITDPNTCFLCSLELTAFFFRIAMGHQALEKLSPSRPAQEYHKLVLTMQRGVRENYSMEDLSYLCNISISYIKELFQRYAGISPKSYYAKLRCEEAIRLLENGKTVQEVSDTMCFSSPAYFSSFFKKHTGLPPARYMKTRFDP